MMEILQAVVYTTRYIFRNGNLDWYYIMAASIMALLLVSKKYKKYFKTLIVFFALLFIMECGSIILVDVIHTPKDFITSAGKMTLCFSIMLGTIEYFAKLDLKKFLYCAVAIHAIETVIAFVIKGDFLWRTNDITNKFYETRLQLIYLEPSELSMCAAILIILLVYLIEKESFHYLYLAAFGILTLDMYFSAGMGGILALGAAAGIVMLYKALEQVFTKRKIFLIGVLLGVSVATLFVIYGTDIPMAQRTRLILGGELFADDSTTWRLLLPMKSIGPLLQATKFAGVGLGTFNAKTTEPLLIAAYGNPNWFPNSFLYFVAEGGIVAIIILLAGIIYLGYRAFKSKSIGMLLLFVFIVVYQIPGGYFTNPLNWICYGIILSNHCSIHERNLDNGNSQED